MDTYTFHLSQETELFYDPLGPVTGNGVAWTLTGPRGVEANGPYLYQDSPVLKLVAGDYKISFAGTFGQLGSYNFRLFNLANPTPITLGTTVSDAVDLPGGTKVYSFAGTAGDHISYDNLDYSGNANHRIIDPNGKLVGQSTQIYGDQNISF